MTMTTEYTTEFTMPDGRTIDQRLLSNFIAEQRAFGYTLKRGCALPRGASTVTLHFQETN